MSASPRHSLNGASSHNERSRDPSFSRSRSRSAERRDFKHSHRSSSPRYREERSGYNSKSYDSKSYDKYTSASSSSRRRYSRSRSRSPSPSYSKGRRGRSGSRSPMSTRRRHLCNREDPNPSNCLGIFGLSLYTTERQLHHLFGKYGPINKVQVVLDAKTGRSRGFAFIYYENVDDAADAKEQCTGMEIDGRRIRVDFSITERAHTPTPGIYMGRPTYSSYGRRGGGGGSGGSGSGSGGGGGGGKYNGGGGSSSGGYTSKRRSPSPYHRSSGGPSSSSRRSYRSRSRSYSPRLEENGVLVRIGR